MGIKTNELSILSFHFRKHKTSGEKKTTSTANYAQLFQICLLKVLTRGTELLNTDFVHRSGSSLSIPKLSTVLIEQWTNE